MAGNRKASGRRPAGRKVANKVRKKAARPRPARKHAVRSKAAEHSRAPAKKGKLALRPGKPRGKAPAKPLKPPASPVSRPAAHVHRAADDGSAGRPLRLVEAFCPRCKSETQHSVASMMGEKIRRVRCGVCGTEHNFHRSQTLKLRSARTEVQAPVRKRREEQRAHTHARIFEEQMLGRDPGHAKPYDIKDKYYHEDLVTHPLFGLGLVTRIKEDGKIEVLFREGSKTLAHNRFVPPPPPGRKGRQ